MLPTGIKVFHPEHGEGEVAGRNGFTGIRCFEEKLKGIFVVASYSGIISSLATSFYSGDKYPNIIRFSSGHVDAYADEEITVIN